MATSYWWRLLLAMTMGVLTAQSESPASDACDIHQQPCMLPADAFALRLVPGFFTPSEDCPGEQPHYAPHLGLRADKTWQDVERALADTSETHPKKLVIFLRHGQATHNADKLLVGDKDWIEYYKYLDTYVDAPLTPKGIADAERAGEMLAQELREHGLDLDLVIVSPLDRTLQTYEGVFAKIDKKIPVISLEIVRETLGMCPCDKRDPTAPKRVKYPNIDLSAITQETDTWWRREHRETDLEIEARARQFLHHIFFERPEKRILVVSHSGFSRGNLRALGHRFFHPQNGEFVPLLLEQVRDCPAAH